MQDRLNNLTNPICMAQSYRDQVIMLLPNLSNLDGNYNMVVRILDTTLLANTNQTLNSLMKLNVVLIGDKLKGLGSDFYKLCNQLDKVIAGK